MEVQLNWCWITGWFVQIHFVNIIWDISAHHLHRSNLNLSYKIFWIAHKSLENGYCIPKGYDIILWLENVSWIVTLPFYRSKISSTHASNFWKGCNLSCSAALTLKQSPWYVFFLCFSHSYCSCNVRIFPLSFCARWNCYSLMHYVTSVLRTQKRKHWKSMIADRRLGLNFVG